jgi:hypothetical protein
VLDHGWWFSPGTPAYSTTKTERHDIAEILLKVALNTKNQIKIKSIESSGVRLKLNALYIVIFTFTSYYWIKTRSRFLEIGTHRIHVKKISVPPTEQQFVRGGRGWSVVRKHLSTRPLFSFPCCK